jgi:CheY-specific phosphatase CheX
MENNNMIFTIQPPTSEPQRLIPLVAHEACRSLFDAYGVTLESTDGADTTQAKVLLCGVVGFAGPGIRGTCILAATEEPISKSIPVSGSLRDWIAELSNQLVGRIKNKLLGYGAEVYITSPAVVRGEHLAAPSNCAIKPLSFATAGGNVFVWVDVETDESFTLINPPEPPGASEGEALLF